MPLSQYLVIGIDNRALSRALSRTSSGALSRTSSGASCRASVELRAELCASLPLSFVPQSSRKAPQLYAEGWRRGRKRSALVFTARLSSAEVELGPLRRRIPLN